MSENAQEERSEEEKYKFKAAAFLLGVTGISAIAGFGTTLARAKKTEPDFFKQGIVGQHGLKETGASLAMRALGWGTIWAITGCSVIFFGIWKLSGASNFDEFRLKMGHILPKLSKTDQEGQTEFENLTDLMDYLNRTYSKPKHEEATVIK